MRARANKCLKCGRLSEPSDAVWREDSREMRGVYCCEACARGKNCICEEYDLLTRAW